MEKVKPFYIKYAAAFILALLYFLFHFHYMQQYLDWDQIGYKGNVQKALRPGRIPYYNPHHLHLETGSKYFHLFMVEEFGDDGFTELLFNNRLKSLLAACLGIFFGFLYFTNITGKLTWGTLGTLLIGFSHGYMVYATKFDTGIFPACGILLFLWAQERLEKSKRGTLLMAVITGIILFVGLMFHQFLAIACSLLVLTLVVPPWVFGYRLDYRTIHCYDRLKTPPVIDRVPAKRYKAAFIAALVGVVLTAGAYFWAGASQNDLPFDMTRPWEEPNLPRVTHFQHWLFSYASVKSWGKGLSEFNPKYPFRGYTDGFISRGRYKTKYTKEQVFEYDLDDPVYPKNLTSNALAVFTLFTFFAALLLSPFLVKRYRRGMLFLLSSTVMHFIFSTYWEPYYLEFWIVPAILASALFVLILNYLYELFGKIRLKPLAPLFVFCLFAFVVIIGVHNFHEHLVPYSREKRLEYTSSPEILRNFSTYIYNNPDNPYEGIYKKR